MKYNTDYIMLLVAFLEKDVLFGDPISTIWVAHKFRNIFVHKHVPVMDA